MTDVAKDAKIFVAGHRDGIESTYAWFLEQGTERAEHPQAVQHAG